MLIRGYAAPFNRPAYLPSCVETIASGAFELRALDDVTLVYGQHEATRRMARTADRSMRLWQDGFGLAFEADVDAAGPAARGIVRGIASDDVGHCSVSLHILAEEVSDAADGVSRRVTRARLDHIALVATPAYADTACWLAENEGEGVSPRVAAFVERWHVGWAPPAGRRASAPVAAVTSVRAKPACPPSVQAILQRRPPAVRRA